MPLEPDKQEALERAFVGPVQMAVRVMRSWGLSIGECFYELGRLLQRIEKLAMEAEHREADIGG